MSIVDPEFRTVEQVATDWTDRTQQVTVAVVGNRVVLDCADGQQAADLANSVALLLVGRVADMRATLDRVPTRQQRLEALARNLEGRPSRRNGRNGGG